MGRTRRFFGIAAALALAIAPVQAQQGRGGPGWGRGDPAGPQMGRSLELALENQEALGLSGEQAAKLQEMKTVLDRDVAGLVEEMESLREKIRSGELNRTEGFRQMEALRGELITASAPLRGRVQEILTVEQHGELQRLVRETRPGLGRAGGVRGGGGPSPLSGRAAAAARTGSRGSFQPHRASRRMPASRGFRRGWGQGLPRAGGGLLLPR